MAPFLKDYFHNDEKIKIQLRSETFNYIPEKLAFRSDFSQEISFCHNGLSTAMSFLSP